MALPLLRSRNDAAGELPASLMRFPRRFSDGLGSDGLVRARRNTGRRDLMGQLPSRWPESAASSAGRSLAGAPPTASQ
jgi:hypothetical protein